MAVDALGNEIIIGKKYGYSTRDSGWTTTAIGNAKKITPTGKVTLENVVSKTYLYGKPSDYQRGSSGSSSVTSILLFPIPE